MSSLKGIQRVVSAESKQRVIKRDTLSSQQEVVSAESIVPASLDLQVQHKGAQWIKLLVDAIGKLVCLGLAVWAFYRGNMWMSLVYIAIAQTGVDGARKVLASAPKEVLARIAKAVITNS